MRSLGKHRSTLGAGGKSLLGESGHSTGLPQITRAAESRFRWMGLTASIFFHLGILFLGAVFLLRPARFHVMSGRTSTEIGFTVVREIISPKKTPLSLPPAPPAPSVSVAPLHPSPVAPKAVTSTSAQALPVLPPVRSQPATRLATASHPAPAKEANQAAKGAMQAQPDELHNQPPKYPEDSRTAHEEGEVMLRVSVTASGRAAGVEILKSSGYFRLDGAARRAVEHWQFQPAEMAGIPASSQIDVPVRFRLQ